MPTTPQKAFTISGGKGFQLKFPNGFIVSVQFGMGNYCDNHYLAYVDSSFDSTILGEGNTAAYFSHGNLLSGFQGSDTAETAIMDPTGKFVPYSKEAGLLEKKPDDCGCNDVQGHMSLMDVLKMLLIVAALPCQIEAPVTDVATLPEPEEVDGEVV